MLNYNTMEYGVWVRALNRLTVMEVKVNNESEMDDTADDAHINNIHPTQGKLFVCLPRSVSILTLYIFL